MAKTRRVYSAEFKREAVQSATKPGGSIAQAAKELGVHDTILRRWIEQFGSGRWEKAPGNELKTASALEVERLKRELNRVRMERDILKNGLRGPTTSHVRRNKQLLDCIGARTVAVRFLEG